MGGGRRGDVRPFDHTRQVIVRIGSADAARHGAALREGVAHAVAHHAVAVLSVGFRQPLTQYAEAVAAVEVVGVDDGERFADDRLAHQHGVVRTPWLGASFGADEALGQVVDRLEDHLDGDVVFVFGEDLRAKIRFEILADDEDHLAEAAADGVEDRVIHDRLAVGAETVQLFETAVARAHACGQYEKCRFHKSISGFRVYPNSFM